MHFLMLHQFISGVIDVTAHLWNILKINFLHLVDVHAANWHVTHRAGKFDSIVECDECFRETKTARVNVFDRSRPIIVKCKTKLAFAFDATGGNQHR